LKAVPCRDLQHLAVIVHFGVVHYLHKTTPGCGGSQDTLGEGNLEQVLPLLRLFKLEEMVVPVLLNVLDFWDDFAEETEPVGIAQSLFDSSVVGVSKELTQFFGPRLGCRRGDICTECQENLAAFSHSNCDHRNNGFVNVIKTPYICLKTVRTTSAFDVCPGCTLAVHPVREHI